MQFSRVKLLQYIDSLYDSQSGAYASVYGQRPTLYGSGYALSARYYLGLDSPNKEKTLEFVRNTQDEETGYFIGPELRDWSPDETARFHTREHLLMHLACSTLPVLAQFGTQPKFPLKFAHAFTNQDYLLDWLNKRDLNFAWVEGNNLLFIGQFLVYLRDEEKHPDAQKALETWFKWLDEKADPKTGLWGTDLGIDHYAAVYGGYHQLLVYYHENHPVNFPEKLVDVVLDLQHPYDGAFAAFRGGGACADVDCVDVLVNLYKICDYRRTDIRCALRKCLNHLWTLQQDDGGFPSTRGEASHIHMGIPATKTSREHSGMFETWFRIHTMCLIAEILTDDSRLQSGFERFNSTLSMGWHPTWNRNEHLISSREKNEELPYHKQMKAKYWKFLFNILKRKLFGR